MAALGRRGEEPHPDAPDRYLAEAEEQLRANGAQVHWADDAAEARDIVLDLAKRRAVGSVVKGKSMVTGRST